MSEFFTQDEFKCKCKCGMDINDSLKEKVILARRVAKTPFTITSGARCEKHNKKEGGSKSSSHLKGLAVDIKATTSRERFKIISAMYTVGFNRIGVAKDFLHFDIDINKTDDLFWLY